MPTSIVFFGSSPLSNIVLEKVLRAGCEVLGVVTKPDRPVGRGQKVVANPVKDLAESHNLLVYDSLASSIQHLGSGVIGLVAAYGKIIPQSTLDTFNSHIYNIHPSLLPKYRGPSPLQQQILDDVEETGVTIIQIDAQMDHGPIVAQEKDVILPNDTWITLGERLFSKGTDLFISNIQHLGSSIPQVDSLATYTKLIARQDGFLEFEEFRNCLKIENLKLKISRMLRAFDGWPGVWTSMPDGKRLKLVALTPTILVQVEGKSPQPWKL